MEEVNGMVMERVREKCMPPLGGKMPEKMLLTNENKNVCVCMCLCVCVCWGTESDGEEAVI